MQNNVYPDVPTSAFRLPATANTTNRTLLFTGPGIIDRIIGWNAAVVTWLHFYDAGTAAGVTVGTTVPKLSLRCTVSANFDDFIKVAFTKGCVIATTTTATGSTAPAVNAIEGLNITFANQ